MESASGASGPASGGLEMNQTLETSKKDSGKPSKINHVSWNTVHRKLATSDEDGQVIIWLLNNNVWTVEMVNDRPGKKVTDLKWSPDGEKVFIAYNDGSVIVGGVGGNRLWWTKLESAPQVVEWAPDSRLVYIANEKGQVEVYDACPAHADPKAENPKLYTLANHCAAQGETLQVASIHFADNRLITDPTQPMLAVAYTNGKVQLMTTPLDANPVLFDSGLKLKPGSALRWAPDGFCFAVAGHTVAGDGMLYFVSPKGASLRNLRLPTGQKVEGLDWEGNGQRVVIASGSALFICDVKRQRQIAYAERTIVSAYQRRDKEGQSSEWAVTFWDTATSERCSKIISSLVHLKASEELTVLASVVPDAAEGPYVVLVLTGLGAGSITHQLPCEPKLLEVSATHLIASDRETVCILNYAAAKNPSGLQIARAYTQPKDEVVFHAFSDPQARSATTRARYMRPHMELEDGIAALAICKNSALVGCDSGIIHRYSLPRFSYVDKINVGVLPASLHLNMDGSALALVDFDGSLSLWGSIKQADVPKSTEKGDAPPVNKAMAALEEVTTLGELKEKFDGPKRSDVWQVMWAKDTPNLLAVMEKSRLSVLRNGLPEEPLTSTAQILAFEDLKLTVAHTDVLCARHPTSTSAAAMEQTFREAVREVETKALRDLKGILRNIPDLVDASAFVEQLDHPRLWALLAEAALERLDLGAAEKAFARVEDFRGLQFTRRLRQIEDKSKQSAEVAAFFGAFDEAEQTYLELGRTDLAVDLRRRLGDAFRVLQLVKQEAQGGVVGAMLNEVALMNAAASGASSIKANESLESAVAASDSVRKAHQAVAEYLIDRSKWSLALEHLLAAGDWAGLVEGYFVCERFEDLWKLGLALPKHSPLCTVAAQKLAVAGLSQWAVEVHLRGPSDSAVKNAIDCCIQLSEWATAIRLAEEHAYPQTETLLERYADTLSQRGQVLQAVQLYRRAGRNLQASTLLRNLASDFSLTGKLSNSPADLEAAQEAKELADASIEGLLSFSSPVLKAPDVLKKIHLLAALEAQEHRDRMLEQEAQSRRNAALSIKSPKREGEEDDEDSMFDDGRKRTIRLAAENATTIGGKTMFQRQGGAAGGNDAGKRPDAVGTLLAAEKATMATGATQLVGATKLGGGVGGGTDTWWRGVDALHLYLLVHANLHRGAEDDAFRSAYRLVEFEDVVPPRIAWALLALCAVRVRLWGEASRAWSKLEMPRSKDFPPPLAKAYADLAVQLFTRFPPVNPEVTNERPYVPCPSCEELLPDWAHSCGSCHAQLPFCVLSGRSIFTPELAKTHMSRAARDAQVDQQKVAVQIRDMHVQHPQQSAVLRCSVCKHFTFKMHAHTRKTCALCHAPVSALKEVGSEK